SAATLAALIAACGGAPSTATSAPGAPTRAAGGGTATSPTSAPTSAAGGAATAASPTPLAQTVGSPAANPVAVPTAAAFVDREFLVALNAEPPTLDVHNTGSNAALGVFKCLYEGLVSLDEKLRVVNLLAKSWEPAPDAKSFTFHLQQGVKFHDGTPFNAQAVKDAFDRVLAPDSKLTRHTFFGNVIDHWEVIDDGTLKLVAKLPFAAMIATLAHPAGGIPSPAALKKYGDDFGIHPVGTGPFQFGEWVRGDHILLQAYADYWSKPIGPAVSRLRVKGITEPSSLGIAVQSGQAQFAGPIAAPQAQQLRNAQGMTISETASITGYFVTLNNTKKPFDDKRVRQALNYGVNKEDVLKAADLGQGKLLDSPLAAGIYGYHSVKTYPYDPQQAKSLLAQAGLASGFKAPLWTGAGDNARAVAVQAQLKAIGVDIDVVQMEAAALTAETAKPVDQSQIQMIMSGFSPSTGDADLQLRLEYTKAGWPPTGFNNSFYDNPDVDQYVQQGLQLVDPTQRVAAYAKAQELIMDDAVNIFLYAPTYFGAIRDEAGGVFTQPDGVVYMRTAYYKK
ncbi:MAG TPA: ABC transporter substrate-binding protein, partial [Thermomicrobiales bacterium]|nr:ABC transporter substrate-binding protein [Thermomicrobiales bacterium]